MRVFEQIWSSPGWESAWPQVAGSPEFEALRGILVAGEWFGSPAHLATPELSRQALDECASLLAAQDDLIPRFIDEAGRVLMAFSDLPPSWRVGDPFRYGLRDASVRQSSAHPAVVMHLMVTGDEFLVLAAPTERKLFTCRQLHQVVDPERSVVVGSARGTGQTYLARATR